VGVELTDVVARLYTVPPDAFVAEREDAVGRARKAGDRQLAARIAKLRKPTLAAWLVNLLAHQRPDQVGELLALGDELRDAQRDLRGAELRELSLRRRAAVTSLVREAHHLAVAAGRPVRDKLPLAEVEQTLAAALAEQSVADEVRAGRLTRPMLYAGFGETPRPQLRLLKGGRDAEPEDAEPTPGQHPGRGRIRVTTPREDRETEVARRAAERKAAADLAREMKAARRELLDASLEMVDAQAARKRAEAARKEAEAARKAAEKALAKADQAMAEAQERVERAQATLDKLTARGG